MPPWKVPLDERSSELAALAREIIGCRKCPRLVAWREEAARLRPLRYASDRYWARPLPGWGTADARVIVVGLAPAAHGGNRTGRIFTGDRSGDFLFASLHRTGFANQPWSVARDDGLTIRDLYITAVNRSAPPGNRPTPEERDNCLPFLIRELELLSDARVVVCLGAYAWDGVLRALAVAASAVPRPRFGHGAEVTAAGRVLLGCFHPSQQNTFTGKLRPEMLDAVFGRARILAGLPLLGPRDLVQDAPVRGRADDR